MMRYRRATLVWAMLALSGPVRAAATAAPDITLDGTIAGVSDYNFRGLSLSGGEPALQGSLDLLHSSGFSVGLWSSTLGDARGADLEVDLYAGWTGTAGPVSLDVGVFGYVYPDGSDLDYVEFHGSSAWALGPATATVGVNYAPEQDNIGGENNVYLYGDLTAEIRDAPLTLRAHVGYEDGGLAGAGGEKLDWSAGLDYAVGDVVLGATYIDTNLDGLDVAGPSVVFSVGLSF